MNPVGRNLIAIIAGAVIGGAVNMGIIMVSGSIIAPPEGVDMTTPEGLAKGMELLEAKHFIMPFLAHALGTLVGAIVAAGIAAKRKILIALLIGVLFFIGGLMMVFMVPAPKWFVALDLIVAYIPMAYMGGRLMRSRRRRR